jgi:hypothetical protein
LKGIKLRTALTFLTVLLLAALAGCNGAADKDQTTQKIEPPKEGKELLAVDFQPGQDLRYKFVSSRDIFVNWEPEKRSTRPGQDVIDKHTEVMEMVILYSPVEVDPYGLTTIKATCESVRATRSKRANGRSMPRDAVEYLKGKTFTIKVNAVGNMKDNSQLNELIKLLGEKAFRANSRMGRIKEPDMIGDFIASQWFLWDSISSIKKPSEGVSVGDSWSSQLSVPTPMVMRKARDVTYTLDEIRETDKGRIAVINSTYTLADSVPADWPVPYTGSFRMPGTFGFLRGYKVLGLKGQGRELFNIDEGRIEQYNQQYRIRMNAALLGNLGPSPQITINQKITMQFMK